MQPPPHCWTLLKNNTLFQEKVPIYIPDLLNTVSALHSVLYVDDEPSLIEIGKLFLERSGEFSIDTKTSARDGLQALKERRYDAIISDYQMPEMNGIEFLKEVRSAYGDLPFIIFTGKGREEIVIEALNNGADFYLQKSGDPNVLYPELMHIIRRTILMRETQLFFAEQEQRYYDIQNANDLIQSVAPDGHFLFVNKKWLDTLGYQEHEIPDITIFDIIHDESLEHCKVLFSRIISGENVGIIDAVFKTRDGKKVYAEGISSCKITEGKPQYTRGIFKDVTDRKLAEAALKESEEKFRALVEHSLDGILITDFYGKILFLNNAAAHIIETADYRKIIGEKTVLDFVAPESRADILRDLHQIEQGIDAYLTQYKFITGTRREIWVESIGKKIPFGKCEAILVSIRDITGRKHAEEALREEENKFATVFRSSPVPLTLVRAEEGTFIDVNDAFVRNTGYSRDEVIGNTSEGLGLYIDENERERMISLFRTERGVSGEEMHYRIKNGEIRTCLVSAGLIMLGGKPHFLTTIDDITERKNTVTAFQAMVRGMVGTTGFNSLQKITESVSSWLGADCVMVGEIQPDNQTVKVLSMVLDGNEIPEFSYTLEGTPCSNVVEQGFCLYPDNVFRLFPESRDLSGFSLRGYIGTPLQNSGGKVFGTLCALSRSPMKSTNIDREILDIIAVKAAAEIERTQMERALRESEARFRNLMDHIPGVSIQGYAPDGIVRYWNKASEDVYGYMAEEAIGKNLADLIIPVDLRPLFAQCLDVAKELTQSGEFMPSGELLLLHKDGHPVPVYSIHTAVCLEGMEPLLFCIDFDLSERKRIEEDLRESNKKLQLISSITRHDINNQLMVLDAYLELLYEEVPHSHIQEYILKIRDASARISSMIRFTKMYEQIGVRAPAWQDLRPHIETAENNSHLVSIRLVNDIPAGTEVFTDTMLEKVFFNLLDNSLRHSQRVTLIHVSCSETDGGLTIYWEDNGVGVPEEEKARIFERGYGKNTGLGLSLVREILAFTGITIHENGEPGKGARFEILVPKGVYRTSGTP